MSEHVTGYPAELRALAQRLREIAAMPPAEAMLALGLLGDAAGQHSALLVIRSARAAAAELAVEAAGSQAALARQLGVSSMLISRAVRGEVRR